MSQEIADIVRKKFRHLSNQQLVDRANELPDFQWDDEETELARRIKDSNGKLEIKMIGSQLKIMKDEKDKN